MKTILTTVLIILGLTIPSLAEWVYETNKDPLDGGETLSASFYTDDGKSAVDIACVDNSTLFFIRTVEYLGSGTRYTDGISAKYKIDNGPVKEEVWGDATEGRGAVLWRSSAIKFLKSLYKGQDELFLRLTGYRYNSIDIVLPLDNIEQPINKISEKCSWTP